MATKVERLCSQCSAPMPITARSHAETCSPRCRKARSRAQQLPVELTSRDRWVRYTAKKMPLTVSGRAASSTDPATWSSYTAVKASTAGVGAGFVLAAGDGLACIDLDHALDASGRPEPWAQRILDTLPPTFIEISLSGRGLHVFGLAPAGPGRKIRRGETAVEIYTRGRFIAVTGNRFAGAPARLADLADVISMLAVTC
ncbi:bifunctional DNA primase/polymerase [Streptomyces sp. NBC_00648]|uniref:bifunctional DNA primase/polymerase n=1 Tax=Streptomyces sp. NBC_00648 TaxID=2975797 RepID=UPI003246D796